MKPDISWLNSYLDYFGGPSRTPVFEKPFKLILDDQVYAMATNGSSAVLIRADNDFEQLDNHFSSSMSSRFKEWFERTLSGMEINFQSLKSFVGEPPWLTKQHCEICNNTRKIPCPHCDGTGIINCICPCCDHEHESDCPDCDGFGEYPCDCDHIYNRPINRPGKIDRFYYNLDLVAATIYHLPGDTCVASFPDLEWEPLILRGSDWLAAVMPIIMSNSDCPEWKPEHHMEVTSCQGTQ